MISVCMATYNGEKYIEAQMESIRKQTLPPDEVILCDDFSTDKTADLIQNFINRYHLKGSWHLYRNDSRKGYPGNFYYAMSLCKGDFVFLSDQDDVWGTKKLEQMTEILAQHEKINVVCCKFGLIDNAGKEIYSIMAPTRTKKTEGLRRITVSDFLYKCEWPGMVLAYRNAWYKGKLTFWISRGAGRSYPDTIPHDFLICAWASEEDAFYQMDQKLAWHRRHGENVGGEEHKIYKLLNRERKLMEIKDYVDMLKEVTEREVLLTPEGREATASKYRVMMDRYKAMDSKSLRLTLKWAWKNRHEVRLATVICDIIICMMIC